MKKNRLTIFVIFICLVFQFENATAQIISWNLSNVLNYNGTSPNPAMPAYPAESAPLNSAAAVYMPGTPNANLLTDNENRLNNLRRGAGLSNLSTTNGVTTYANLSSGFVATANVSGGDYQTAVDNNLYYEFSVSASANNYLHCNELRAIVRRSGSVVGKAQWAYRIVANADLGKINDASYNAANSFKQIGGELTEADGGNGKLNITQVTYDELKNVSSGNTVFFRLYIYGFTNIGGNTFAIRSTTGSGPAMSLEGTVTNEVIDLSSFSENYKIATYNLRYKNTIDEGNLWADRKANLIDVIKRYSFDAFGVQEAYSTQLADVKAGLTNFDWVGKDRDGSGSSEYTAIFYNTAKFNKVSNGHFWLSETPNSVSLGWDALYERVCSWVQLQDKISGYTFFVFNTHFDHQGELSRENSVTLIHSKISEIANGKPAIFCGDLNFSQGDNNYVTLNTSELLKDSYVLAKKIDNVIGTLNSFNVDQRNYGRIDHIFVTNNLNVNSYRVITDSYSGKMPSDHNPVVIEITKKLNEQGELYSNFPEDFGLASKSDYQTATLTFRTGSWKLINVNLGASSTNDRASSGKQALRINDNDKEATAEMQFDLTEGVSKVTVEHSIYEAHGPSKWALQYSTDNGNTWLQLGDVVYTSQPEKRLAVFYTDIREAVRFRIYRFPGSVPSKLSIDDLAIYKRKTTASSTSKSKKLSAWRFDTPETNGNETSLAANYVNQRVEVSALVRGAGLLPQEHLKSFASRPVVTTNALVADTAVAIANNLYYQFSIKPKAAVSLSLETVNVAVKAAEDGGASLWYWKYSTDGVNYHAVRRPFNNASSFSASLPTLDLSQVTNLQNLTSATTVYLRLYQIGAEAGAGFTGLSTADAVGVGNDALTISGKIELLAPEKTLLAWYLNGATITNGGETSVDATLVNEGTKNSALVKNASLTVLTYPAAFVAGAPVASGSSLADTTIAIANNLYFGFNAEIKPGYKSSLTRLYYKVRTSGGGAKYWHWKYSLDGQNFNRLEDPKYGNTNGGSVGKVMEDVDLSNFPQLQNLQAGTVIYFRLYFSGSNNSSGSSGLGISAASNTEDYVLALYGSSESLTPMPVKLTSFKGKALGKSNQLTWQTASEQNNSHFELQKLDAKGSFQTIGQLSAAKTNRVNTYNFTDRNVRNGVSYYRLRQVDLDGTITDTEAVAVANTISKANIAAYFTTNDLLQVNGLLENEELLTLVVTDISGKTLYKSRVAVVNEILDVKVDASRWNKGVYILSLKGGKSVNAIKVSK